MAERDAARTLIEDTGERGYRNDRAVLAEDELAIRVLAGGGHFSLYVNRTARRASGRGERRQRGDGDSGRAGRRGDFRTQRTIIEIRCDGRDLVNAGALAGCLAHRRSRHAAAVGHDGDGTYGGTS